MTKPAPEPFPPGELPARVNLWNEPNPGVFRPRDEEHFSDTVARHLREELIDDVESAYYLHIEMADRPGVLAALTQVLGEHGVSIKSMVQRGMGQNARLVMVTHSVLESRLRRALQRVAEFEFVRASPRMIRVIEEEFV